MGPKGGGKKGGRGNKGGGGGGGANNNPPFLAELAAAVAEEAEGLASEVRGAGGLRRGQTHARDRPAMRPNHGASSGIPGRESGRRLGRGRRGGSLLFDEGL